jgi:hypothetical protein
VIVNVLTPYRPKMSVAARKCGVHLLQPPSIVTTTIRSTTDQQQQNVEKKKMEPTITTTTTMSSQRKSSGENKNYETMVESFLDDNTDFLEDYVRR